MLSSAPVTVTFKMNFSINTPVQQSNNDRNTGITHKKTQEASNVRKLGQYEICYKVQK
jgi:hypothetical protein